MFGPVYFLSGDAFPGDRHVDAELRARVGDQYSRWIDQAAIYHPDSGPFPISDFERRAAHLETFLQREHRTGSLILMGRSAGARLATWYANRHPVRAVVCFGYPFKNPANGDEPQRYAHLAQLTVPTLIIQGTRDEYGGRELLEKYSLSPAIRVEFVDDADHGFHITGQQWDKLTEEILAFCSATRPARQPFASTLKRLFRLAH
jgi:pimeloyl-ACP methyl ester carboxylesterase